MIKLIVTFLVASLLVGCGYREENIAENMKEVFELVKEACDKGGGTLVRGMEYTATMWGDEVTVGFYCIPPSKEDEQ